jgi:hypothetical protein
MKNKNYGMTFGSFALFVGGLIFKFLWFVFLFILVWGVAKFIFDLPCMKSLQEKLHLKKIDDFFSSKLSILYDFLPNKIYYLFLLRVPIISGLILFFIPLISQFVASNFLQNIFVMKDGIELILVMVFATFTAITIVSLLKTILVLIDNNFNDNTELKIGRTLLTVILFLPTWGLLLYLNNEQTNIEDINWIYRFLGTVIGFIPFVIAQLYEYNIILPLDKNLTQEQKKDKIEQRRKTAFFGEIVSGVVFYILVINLNWPSSVTLKDWQSLKNWQNSQAPTLLYLLLLIWIFTLFVGIVTLIFDESIDDQLDQQKELLLDFKPQDKVDPEKKTELEKKIKLYNHTFYWPVILFLIVFAILGNQAIKADHFFKLEKSEVKIENYKYKEDFQQAIWNRLCNEKFDIKDKTQTCDENKPKSLAVVAASGGGIQASGWMTQVLAGLQDEKSGIGEDFIKAIGLISSASGGSVGSMFYLNEFDKNTKVLNKNGLAKVNKNSELSQVVANATDDWLNSVGWGLAFPDFFRTIGFSFVLPSETIPSKLPSKSGGDQDNEEKLKKVIYLDRGYALENNWEKTLMVGRDKADKPPTLDDRREQILKGEVPISVYNTTLVENGRPFLVSSMKFVEGKMADYANDSSKKMLDDTALDFKTLYNNCGDHYNESCDIALTTAARLSASFPYVTPMARNDRENIIKNKEGKNIQVKDKNGNDTDFLQNYHIADGGYYDNSGAFTALKWLDNFLKNNDDLKEKKDHYININKVLLLQINAFPEEHLQLYQEGSSGVVVSMIGPLNTLAGIRDSTQIGRNLKFAKLLNDRWGNIDIKNFTISFPKSKLLKDEDGNPIKDKDGKEINIPYNPPLSWRLTQSQKQNLVEAWQEDHTIRTTVNEMKGFWNPERKD